MSKMLVKNTLRDVSKTKARFISIMLIIMLGVGFLVGINSTAPSMFKVVDEYYKDKNLMDFRLLSTVGFTEEDVKAVADIEGVDDVMPSYFADVLLKGDTGSVVRLYSLPEKYDDFDVINDLTLVKGRYPEKADEILVGEGRFGEDDIGTKIGFASPYEDKALSDTLEYSEYTIVGIANSPLYISFERGSTNVGSGKISDYMFIRPESFAYERYTELYVTFSELRDSEPYSAEYKSLRDSFEYRLQNAGNLRIEAFIKDNITTAQASIDEAQAMLFGEKRKADKGFENAQASIDEAEEAFTEEVATAEINLADAKEKIDSGESELLKKREEFSKETEAAQKEINKGRAEVEAGKEALANGKVFFKEELYKSVNSLGITREQFDNFWGDKDMITEEDVDKLVHIAYMYRDKLTSQLSSLEVTIRQMEEDFALSGEVPLKNEHYKKAKEKEAELNASVSTIDTFLGTGKEEIVSSIEKLNKQETGIKEAEQKLDTAQSTLDSKIEEAQAKFEETETQLLSARQEYENGLSQLRDTKETARAELDDAQAKLDEQKILADDEFTAAQKDIDKAQSDLNSVPEPDWYYYSRVYNPGYDSYDDNVGRLTAVGKVFPVFFLLVAVLVCVTTMSRLIEEQRGDIGALTTIGYKKWQIIGKYIAYSVSATLVGAAVGIALGVMVLPPVLFNAYRMLYSSLPDIIITLDIKSAVIATLVAILCTSLVAFFTCNALLRREPATLLRPKAPKPGKRILLERVKFIWKKLGFFSKVTVRNIFRYKARFFMTVIGVAGCTALIVAAMGLHRSINDVVDIQFGEIFTNDTVIALEKPMKVNSELHKKITSDERFSHVALCRQNLAEVMTGHGFFKDDTYIVVPENTEEYSELVNLRERKSGEKIDFSSDGVILSEKLAKELKVTVGDEIRVVDKDIKRTFTVDGICENYLYGYVFMTPEVYSENFGIEPEYNMYMCKNAQDMGCTEEALGEEYLKEDGVLGISFIGSSIKSFEDMISSLNYVVLVMVVCAAALAFVVLYNLTNINIAERKREISTLKVLGFKNSETSAYIYRENILLTIVGIAVGLLLGIMLLRFVIVTVEIDMVMFGRKMYAGTFIIAAVLTALFAAIVNIVMHLRIKKIDMVESLKSIE